MGGAIVNIPTDGKTHHLVILYAPSGTRVFIDGIEQVEGD